MNRRSPAPFSVPSVAELNEDLGGAYEVLELIGQGGMGAVYKARQPRLNRLVAIKVLPPDLGETSHPDEEDPATRLSREAQVMARLSHPNLVAVHEFGVTDQGLHFIVMEYVDGADLQTLFSSGDLKPEHSFAWIMQICSGLAYAHREGLVHRDIKPANILIDQAGSIKVADFGLAQFTNQKQSPGTRSSTKDTVEGTPDFIAPEVLRSGGEGDHRADIYSLGALIYQMLTGKTPRGLWELPTKLNPELDERFDHLVDRALQPDPENRFQSMSELEEALHEIAFTSPDGRVSSSALTPKTLLFRLALVFSTMLGAQMIGSTFNIWYNLNHIGPLFANQPGLHADFERAILVYNLLAYPPLISLWAYLVFSLRRLPRGSDPARKRILNLPWWALGIAATGWFLTIPGLMLQVSGAPSPFYFHLPISVIIGALIALALGYLGVDLLCQNLLYPHFFTRDEELWSVPGTYSLSLTGRGLFWTVSAGVCPIIAMLLLLLATADHAQVQWFAIAVSAFCILFGLGGAWLLSRLVIEPISQLRQAAQKIGSGDLETRVEILRGDELGILGHEFNRMTSGLRERQHIRETLGQAIRGDLARQLLHREEELSGIGRDLAALSVSIRDFDVLSQKSDPRKLVAFLNHFHEWSAQHVEAEGGIVTQVNPHQILALFGAVEPDPQHAAAAVRSAQTLLGDLDEFRSRMFASESLPETNEDRASLSLSVAIDAGPATVATIGSERRREFTALGPVIQRTQRLADLARTDGHPILVSPSAFEAAGSPEELQDARKELPQDLATDSPG